MIPAANSLIPEWVLHNYNGLTEIIIKSSIGKPGKNTYIGNPEYPFLKKYIYMETNTLEITEQPEGLGFTSIRELVNQTLKKNFGNKLTPDGVSTGFAALDKTTGGLQNGQLYTIAVRPGMGKTAFLLSLTNNMAVKDDYAVAIFSSERSNIKMTNRLIESETGMSLDKLQSGTFKDSERDHMLSLLSNIAKAKIYLDDTPALSVELLAKKAKYLKEHQQLDLVIVDYLELLTAGDVIADDQLSQFADMVKSIKSLAAELDLPVLLFSQASVPVSGKTPRPAISDLPEYTHQDSDVIMMLHRNDAFPLPGNSEKKNAVELVVKNNQTGGAQEEVVLPLTFIESIAKFADFS